MDRYEIAYRFREAFGFEKVGVVGERLEPIDTLLAKLKELKVPRTRVGYTSMGHVDGKPCLKLHLTNHSKDKRLGRVLHFNIQQELVKD
jgi:hypothetical protein